MTIPLWGSGGDEQGSSQSGASGRRYELEQPISQSAAAQAAWAAERRTLDLIESDVSSLLPSATADADGVYAAGDASSWNGAPPTTIRDAFDRIAARIQSMSGTGP
jgi:hypothetical protein